MLLLPDADLPARRALVAPGGPLAATAASLAADLAPVIARPVWVPAEKARLSRAGGRCPRDGTLLTFDPSAPRRHACPRCGGVYDEESHYRWWVMGYQLWLAERAVHAAVLYALLGDPAHARFAAAVLDALADAYLGYPNADNVLGPSRPFFSTYLESLWLLHVCVALDALRTARAPGVRGLSGRVKERLIGPSRTLVGSYDEGGSNRQVWNAAAYLAASSLVGRDREIVPAYVYGGGIREVERRALSALLADGSWYEGDNYHQFAHRGLWYALRLGARAGWAPGPELARRFALGFAVPFRAALPDLTLPARRDAQYGVSLRQWRWAEWCELGLAWPGVDGETRTALGGALATLYAGGTPAADTGRWRATGESERNEPPARLTRADLGWKALLFADPSPAMTGPAPPRSVLLDRQGLAVFRRDRGRLWVGFDFGASTGGAHGHPDRLNLLLADAGARWLDDMGTGSYTERALHWYRSTLAHQAPLVDGRSQPRTPGRLLAYDERAAGGGASFGWADAEAELAPGVRARRALVVAEDHVVDLLTWDADRAVAIDLPVHLDAEVLGAGRWAPADAGGAGGLEDGFDFLRDADRAPVAPNTVVELRASRPAAGDPAGRAVRGWVCADHAAAWWRAVAPGPPGSGERRFVWVRVTGTRGRLATVWDPRGAVRRASCPPAPNGAESTIAVDLADGRTAVHGRDGDGWRVAAGDGTAVHLAGTRPPARGGDGPPPGRDIGDVAPWYRSPHAGANRRWASRTRVRGLADPPTPPTDLTLREDGAPLHVRLGRGDYRRTEPTWAEAGRPRALVTLGLHDAALRVALDVRLGRAPHVAAAGTENDMDNERPDVNSDGGQLYVRPGDSDVAAGWLVVPASDGATRVTPLDRAASAIPLDVRATLDPSGWRLDARLPLAALAPNGVPATIGLDVLVNEMPGGRERRRGQLVLSGLRAPGERAYLAGDRHDPARLVRVALLPG